MINKAFWEGKCLFVLGWAPKSSCRGLGRAGSASGRRKLRPGRVGTAEIGLITEAAPGRTAGMSRNRIRGAASISDPILAVRLVQGAEQVGSKEQRGNWLELTL